MVGVFAFVGLEAAGRELVVDFGVSGGDFGVFGGFVDDFGAVADVAARRLDLLMGDNFLVLGHGVMIAHLAGIFG